MCSVDEESAEICFIINLLIPRGFYVVVFDIVILLRVVFVMVVMVL